MNVFIFWTNVVIIEELADCWFEQNVRTVYSNIRAVYPNNKPRDYPPWITTTLQTNILLNIRKKWHKYTLPHTHVMILTISKPNDGGTCILFCFVWFDSLLPSQQSFSYVGTVFLGWSSTKLELMCLAQGHNAVTPMRLKTADFQSRVKHSTTEPLRTHTCICTHLYLYTYVHSYLLILGPARLGWNIDLLSRLLPSKFLQKDSRRWSQGHHQASICWPDSKSCTGRYHCTLEDDLKAIIKPQYVDQIPRAVQVSIIVL